MKLSESQILRFTEGDPSGTPSGFSILLEVLQTSLYTSPARCSAMSQSSKDTTYRGLLDELIEMPRIRRTLGLFRTSYPFNTL